MLIYKWKKIDRYLNVLNLEYHNKPTRSCVKPCNKVTKYTLNAIYSIDLPVRAEFMLLL